MSVIKKPMLAASMEDAKGNPKTLADLQYPMLASLKEDGIRSLRIDGKTLARSFKEIPNKYIKEIMKNLPDDLDGEIVTYDKVTGEKKAFNPIQSDVMSEDGEPLFEFVVFDYVKESLDRPYIERVKDLEELDLPSFCKKLLPRICNNAEELQEFLDYALARGEEGIMVRPANSPYKCGRSTFKEGFLIKIKPFEDSEAEILGFVEKMHNENEAEVDELGHTKRSQAKAGLVPANTLGKFLVRDIHTGVEFGIGTGKGLGDVLRKEIWDNRDNYLGKIIKYQFQGAGMKDKPRIPSFIGFRDPRDMS